MLHGHQRTCLWDDMCEYTDFEQRRSWPRRRGRRMHVPVTLNCVKLEDTRTDELTCLKSASVRGHRVYDTPVSGHLVWHLR